MGFIHLKGMNGELVQVHASSLPRPEPPVWPRIRNLPREEQQPFRHWLNGQTCPWIEGVPAEEQDGYYVWDYKRWREGRPVID